MTSPISWLHRWPETGSAAFRLGRAGDEVVAEWIGLGTLRAHVSGGWSEFTPAADAHAQQVRERLREHIAALVRQLKGGITLHASSVARHGAGVACIGESGAGKSTLAVQLCQRQGVELLSDDTTALRLGAEAIEIAPTERNHWLRADVARAMGVDPGEHTKVPLAATRPSMAGARLRAIVALAFDPSVSAPSLRPLKGATAFAALSRSTFRFAIDVADVLRAELDGIARIAAETPVFELRRPPGLEYLARSPPLVADLLEQITQDVGR
jgi:hypothetical protein